MGIGGVMVGPPNPDAPQLDAISEKCADPGMPVNLHVFDPYWSYLPQNRFNDGLMNGYSWRMDNKPGIMGQHELER
jgi:hypothetical protein